MVVDGNKVDDFDFESINKRQLAGNIYLAKVTRVEPSLQAAFVEYGGNRHGFLAFSEIHPDYYQIPVADREALLEEERREAEERRAREDESEANGGQEQRQGRKRNRRKSRSNRNEPEAAVAGLEVIEIDETEAGTTETKPDDVPPGLEIADPEATSEPAPEAGPLVSLDPAPIDDVVAGTADVVETGDETPDAPDALAEASVDQTEDPVVDEPAPTAEIADEAVAAVEETAPEDSDKGSDAEVAESDAPGVEADTANDEGSDDTPPKSIAESAGLDDDERVVGDVDGARTVTGESDNDSIADAEDDATSEDADAGNASEPAVDEAPAAPATEEVVSSGQAETPETSAAAPDTADAAADDQVAASEETFGTDDVSEASESSPAAAADAEPTTTAEDATAAPTDGEPTVEGSEEPTKSADGEAATSTESDEARAEGEETEGKSKRSRRRRGRGRKNRDNDENGNSGSDSETSAASDADGDDDDSGPDQPETAGAEDTLEEAAQARTRLRRKYKIQDVVKVRQIMLVQVVKEERGNKGAALTTYLSLAGRYCVLMPNTARGGGISRKITNAGDRKRLREITGELDVPQGMGLIVRTAGAERTRPEIKRDYEFLLRQWEQIRDLTLKSIAPTLIYEEGSLIKRSIRDIYNKEIDQILVEGEIGYREAKEYMKMLMPSHAKNVQRYDDPIQLFNRYQVESYLNGMFNPTVQLKSGGYIVIGVTEALVAIDVNSGRATKQGSIEETALQTNLEAADEVARQLRLRDLAGLIVIDFIDMDENRNNRAVEKRMKERLKNDRARIQVGRISAFGLMEMSRQRLRPGMLEATTQPCPACHGTGLIRSDESLTLSILRELEEEGLRGRADELILKLPVDVANYLINSKRQHIVQIEERHNITITLMADPGLSTPHYEIERSKSPKPRPPRQTDVVTAASVVDDDDMLVDGADAGENRPAPEARDEEDGKSRRRGEDRNDNDDQSVTESDGEAQTSPDGTDDSDDENRKGRRRGRRRGGRKNRGDQDEKSGETQAASEATEGADGADQSTSETAEASSDPVTSDGAIATVAETDGSPDAAPVEEVASDQASDEQQPETATDATDAQEIAEAAPVTEEAPVDEVVAEKPVAVPEPAPEPTPKDPNKPKRRGWWSFGR